jgi:hypothetical protein
MTNAPIPQWQSISTAPRNQMVLVYSLRWGPMVAAFSSVSGTWLARAQSEAPLDDRDAQLITHWMPLPRVPEQLTGSRSPWQSLAA